MHAPSKHAYIHETNNLKERAAIWSSHFNAYDRRGAPIRVRSWPRELKAPGDEWEFRFSTDLDVSIETVQAYLQHAGWTIIKSRRSAPKRYTVQGHYTTLLDHCRRLGIVNWGAVYKRVERGMTPEQALNLNSSGSRSDR